MHRQPDDPGVEPGEPDPKMVFIYPVGPWHDWFAWSPVRTYDQRLCWLRWVRRRAMQKHQYFDGGPDFSWQYHCESRPKGCARWLGWALVGGAIAAGGIAWFLSATDARAHDALPTAAKPNGWSYPFSCCSGYDCREVPRSAISERPEGYVINGTGEVLSYTDTRLKDSPDGEYHWCSVAGANNSRTICLFRPPRGF